jgi:hypothetical protein
VTATRQSLAAANMEGSSMLQLLKLFAFRGPWLLKQKRILGPSTLRECELSYLELQKAVAAATVKTVNL